MAGRRLAKTTELVRSAASKACVRFKLAVWEGCVWPPPPARLQWLASSPPTSLVSRRPVRGLAGRLTLELMVGLGNTNFTKVMPTIPSFRAGGWSGGREAHKDYGTRSFGCKQSMCPFQVSGVGGVRLASSSCATAMARKLTTYVASQSSACPWVGR